MGEQPSLHLHTHSVTGRKWKNINKWLQWPPGSQNNNPIPSESSFQSYCLIHARETWPWLVYRHTYVDSWGCLPVLSAHAYRHRWEITMSRNWTIFRVMKQVTVKYLPIRSQRSSTRLLRLELGWIIFFFVILKEIQYLGLRELDPGCMADCKIRESYLWGNHFIVSNVNVDYFSTCRLALFVYLQQAICELFNLRVCSF